MRSSEINKDGTKSNHQSKMDENSPCNKLKMITYLNYLNDFLHHCKCLAANVIRVHVYEIITE